jgi:hypothetical protein
MYAKGDMVTRVVTHVLVGTYVAEDAGTVTVKYDPTVAGWTDKLCYLKVPKEHVVATEGQQVTFKHVTTSPGQVQCVYDGVYSVLSDLHWKYPPAWLTEAKDVLPADAKPLLTIYLGKTAPL